MFLQYLSVRATARGREITLGDINRKLIDDFLGYLRDRGLSTQSQKNYYFKVKSVLHMLCRRGIIKEILGGDDATFPRNPFPGVAKKFKGAKPMPKSHRQALSLAIKTDILPLFSDTIEPTAYQLTCALLVIALHTGRNTAPLLDMGTDCLCSHPKEDTHFLVVYKRRSNSTSKVALRTAADTEIEAMPSVRPTVVRLIRRIIELAQRLQGRAPAEVRESIWLYRRQKAQGNDLEPTRCGSGCGNAVIGLRHAPIYLGLYNQLKELEDCPDIGEGGRARVRRDLARCLQVLSGLGTPVGAAT